jgi:hypothetical protein
MTTVFISGSKAVSRLNPQIRHRLDHMMKCGVRFVIGDSTGAEKAVQRFLAVRSYAAVTVYYVERCRMNVGNWPTRQAAAPKERALVADAKCAFLLWDGKGRELLHTVRELLSVRKKTLMYFSPSKSFYNIDTPRQLEDFLTRTERGALTPPTDPTR